MGRGVIIRASLFLGFAYLFTPDPVIASPKENVFNIKDYKAKADGKTDNAIAIIRTWKAACNSAGAAKVIVPKGKFMAGEVVLSGPCKASPLMFDIKGTISANSDPSVYSGEAWIKVTRVDNVIITGGGCIDGHGSNMWEYADGGSPLPVSLMFQRVGNSQINNLKMVDSMGFQTKVTDSHDIILTNMTITAPDESPNTDGLHISSTTNLKITDSIIGTGDDCVSVGEGSVDIIVSRVTCGPGHGLSIGSLGKRPDELPVKRITITNCTIKGATNGARIKTFHNSPKLTASDIVFENIVMVDVKNPIIIDQHYSSKSRNGESNVKITDTHFRNIRGTTVSPVAVKLNCSKSTPCEGIELANINLTPSESVKEPLTSACASAKFTTKGKMIPPPPDC